MTKDELIAQYPELFDQCYDFSINEGWMPLVEMLVKRIVWKNNQIIDRLEIGKSVVEREAKDLFNKDYWVKALPELEEKATLLKDNPTKIVQVKEKFGGLRFYTNGYLSSEIYGAIAFAEDYSFKVCEKCSNYANATTTGWIKSLCTDCIDEHNNTPVEKRDVWWQPYTYVLKPTD